MPRMNESEVLSERMNFHEVNAQSHDTAEAVARRSYGKLVAFLTANTRDVAAARGPLAETFASARAGAPRHGCPSNPEARLPTGAPPQNIARPPRPPLSQLST